MKTLYRLQSLILACGSIFAWYTIFTDFRIFYGYEGTIFKIQDCVVTNPFITPCFYGGIVFVIAFVWSLYLIKIQNIETQFQSEKKLWWLLLVGVLFAWGNFFYRLVEYITKEPGTFVGCSPSNIGGHPVGSPCFYGASIFLLAFLVATLIRYRFSKNK